MKPYYISLDDELQYERKYYAEELKKRDWEYLKESSELFLTHAYSHLFETSSGREVFGDANYKTRYSQFYLNKRSKIFFNPRQKRGHNYCPYCCSHHKSCH